MFKSLKFAAAQASRKVSAPMLNAQRGNATKTLYVGNIPQTFKITELHDMFKAFGPVLNLRYPSDLDGHKRGIAFVELKADKAEEAMNRLAGTPMENDRLLKIQFAKDSDKSSNFEG